MKRFLRSLAAISLLLLGTAAAADDSPTILYWMVEDPIVIDLNGGEYFVSEFVASGADAGKTINGARVRVVSTSDGDGVYLDLLDSDGTPSSAQYVSVVPYGSLEPPAVHGGPAMSDISQYAQSGYSFIMELGAWEDGTWYTLAVSAVEAYNAIARFTNGSDIAVPGGTHWAPDAYTVPEPTSGMLAVIGAALLALRRRRVSVG